MIYEYALFDLCIAVCPFVVTSFTDRVHLPKTRPALWAIALIATLFVMWDQVTTGSFWSFNPTYISGLYLGTIPIEEVLFFIVVPYTCLFMWEALSTGTTKQTISTPIITGALLLGSAILLNMNLLYPSAVCTLLAGTVYLDDFLQTHILTRSRSRIYIFIILGCTLLFNSYLTARPIVVYGDILRTGLQIGTIPLEDFGYGFALVLCTTIFYEYAKK